MTRICPNCKTANSSAARFCNHCGQPLSQAGQQAMPGTGLLPPNAVLSNRYIILRKVGQGGMGAVYHAADTRIQGKTWAVKEMSDAALVDPQEKQQAIHAFRREAQLLSQLDHPNIPHVADFFSQEGKQYLVMEFIEGETLEDRMERQGGALAESEVRPWAEQLCDVLDYLHCRQPPVIFRDLKPANIMIDRAGNVKLIDFGIVRFFQPGKAHDTTSFGTAGYAPPEQYGKGQTDARSDLYALGATLHHALTGRDPSLTPFQFQPVRTLNPRVSDVMDQVIAKALQQDPGRRWSNAKAMRRALATPTLRPRPASRPGPRQRSQPVAVSPSAHRPAPAIQAQPSVQRRPAPAIRSQPSARRRQAAPAAWGMETAGFGRRAVAYILDNLLLYVLQFLLALPMGFVTDEDLAVVLSCGTLIVSVLLYVWYFVFLQARSGQTPGKKLLGIRVVGIDGGPVSKGRYFVRLIGYWVDGLLLGIGFLLPLWDVDQQALHDKFANTLVVRA